MPQNFGAQSTAHDVLSGIDLTGKRAIVTGASGGLGEETARALAACGAQVVVAGRDAAKVAGAVERIRSSGAPGAVEAGLVDLASFASVRAFACSVTEPVDLLINNAGVMACPQLRTADGFDMQFGTNHLGHFLLTTSLLERLRPGARVVNLSSAGHRASDVDLDDYNFERTEYSPWIAYGRSKTANVLFSVAAEQRWGDRGIRSIAVHPGGIHTDLGRHMTPEMITAMMGRIVDPDFRWKTVPQGAATTVWAATASDFNESAGVYCEDCRVATTVPADDPGNSGIRVYALDPDRAAALWTLSEQLTAP